MSSNAEEEFTAGKKYIIIILVIYCIRGGLKALKMDTMITKLDF